MQTETIKTKLNEIFRDIFNNPELQVDEAMTADDVEQWDSLSHVDMILMVESEFKIKISTLQASRMKNVGELIEIISQKLGA